MIRIELAMPIVTITQQEQVLKEHKNLNEDAVQKLGTGLYGISTKDADCHKRFELVLPNSAEEIKALKKEGILFGTEGLIWYCHMFNIKIHALTEINLTADLYRRCSGRQWLGISEHASRVEDRNDRLRRLLELDNVPPILIADSMNRLRHAVDSLERNPADENGRKRWSDGTLVRCLNDAGYSLDTGWSDAMKRVFEREQEEYEQRCSEMDDGMHEMPESVDDGAKEENSDE